MHNSTSMITNIFALIVHIFVVQFMPHKYTLFEEKGNCYVFPPLPLQNEKSILFFFFFVSFKAPLYYISTNSGANENLINIKAIILNQPYPTTISNVIDCLMFCTCINSVVVVVVVVMV